MHKRVRTERTLRRKSRLPSEEGARKSAKDIITTHLKNCRAHFDEEEWSRPTAIMQGGRTRYGQWWAGERNTKERPFYEFEPSTVATAIRNLSREEAHELSDALREIAKGQVVEYASVAEAARKQIARISK